MGSDTYIYLNMARTERKDPSPKKKVEEKSNGKVEPEKISLFTHPIKTLHILAIVLKDLGVVGLKFLAKHFIVITLLSTVGLTAHFVKGPHTQIVSYLEDIAFFVIWWVGLGVASSIGFGTGLHTFVLYLGPHIAKVTMIANECGYLPKMLPSRWRFSLFDDCPTPTENSLSIVDILFMVQLEALLWGLGTAIGELPPYFVARAARLSGKDEIEEIAQLEEEMKTKNMSELPFMERAKIYIYKGLQKYGFLTVMLCASIPNPLFDLAGLTCGHFLIPFRTFFTATSLGKAVIKVHIQMLFVIFVFSKHHVEHFLATIEAKFPFLKHGLSQMLEKEKKKLHSPQLPAEDKMLSISGIWNLVIGGMIAFFVISIINTTVNNYLEHQAAKKNGKASHDKKKSKKD
eukprot:TRINITY_DN1441_c0_g1_i1.p1 TRINITY_DN1441_c0_g1~~TRINITY_DN1441_c0_g1_i1.p1  ORF type:complete len:402 (-),score=94.10 TRINITY_DN1441_c0_g1_i1:129-1334(-)